jgi:hypothetical protein
MSSLTRYEAAGRVTLAQSSMDRRTGRPDKPVHSAYPLLTVIEATLETFTGTRPQGGAR